MLLHPTSATIVRQLQVILLQLQRLLHFLLQRLSYLLLPSLPYLLLQRLSYLLLQCLASLLYLQGLASLLYLQSLAALLHLQSLAALLHLQSLAALLHLKSLAALLHLLLHLQPPVLFLFHRFHYFTESLHSLSQKYFDQQQPALQAGLLAWAMGPVHGAVLGSVQRNHHDRTPR